MARSVRVRRRKDTGRYEVNWRDTSGKRRWRTFQTRKAAERFLNKELAEIDAIRAGVKPALLVDKRWEDLVALWEQKKAAKVSLPDDLGRIRNHLDPVLAGAKLADVGPSVVTRLEETQRRKVERGQIQPGTSRKVLVLFGGMMKLGVREGWVAQAPVLELPQEAEVDYQWIRTTEGMRKLIASAREERYRGLPELYATALYTGLRAGELSALEWTDIDWRSLLITVSKSNDRVTKNSRVRRVPYPAALGTMLEGWRGRCHSRRLVFPNLRGNKMGKRARAKVEILERCLERAGLPRMTFHSLRHTFASHFMLAGGDIYRLQKILGHSSVKVTQRYAHLSPEAFRGDHERLPDFL